MIPQPITIDGRTGTVMYINASWKPVAIEDATLARVLFEDGSTAFYTVGQPRAAGADTSDIKIFAPRFCYDHGWVLWDAKPTKERYYECADHFASRGYAIRGHLLPSLRVIAVERLRSLGGAGSGNFGHAGRPGEIGGSASVGFAPGTQTAGTNKLGQTLDPNGKWNESPTGEQPYGWLKEPRGDAYTVPALTHKVVRDGGMWGSSHGNSQMMTGASAAQMGIDGYGGRGQIDARGQRHVTNFLTHIADDTTGSEEVLHHSFENVRGINFRVGDTMRLPLTATSGDVGHYGVRLDAENQTGQPIVFEFPKGTQMVAYDKWSAAEAKEFGHVWSEALVAGGYKVTGVRTEYMGSQHSSTQRLHPNSTHQIYGKVVQLSQTETWHPTKGWIDVDLTRAVGQAHRLAPHQTGASRKLEQRRDLGGAGSGNHGHSGRPGVVGGSGPTTAPASVLDAIRQADGGFTYHAITGEQPTTGFALSVHLDREQVMDASKADVVALAEYAVKNWDLLSQPNNYLGGWHHPESGKVYLDVSTVVKTAAEAEHMARGAKQLAYFDLVKGESIKIDYTADAQVKAASADAHWTAYRRAHPRRPYRIIKADHGARSDAGGDPAGEGDPRQATLIPRTAGGAGSGNYGHSGRPGVIGGSGPSGGSATITADAEAQERDAEAKPGDFTLKTVGSFDDEETTRRKEFDELPREVRDAALEHYLESAYEEVGGDAYGEAKEEARDELRRDNDAVVDAAVEDLAETITFPEKAELFDKTFTRSLDPQSVELTGIESHDGVPELQLDALRTVSGQTLTADEQGRVKAQWEKSYTEKFDAALDEVTESNSFSDRLSELESEAIDHRWNTMSERERLDFVPDRYSDKLYVTDYEGGGSGNSSLFTEASQELGVNAEGLTRSVGRVAQGFSENGTTQVSWESDQLVVKVKSEINGGDVEMNRSFSKGNNGKLIAHHDYFVIDKDERSKGVAAQMLLDSAEVYKRYGVDSIETTANLSVGGYAWAKLGFEARSELAFREMVYNRTGRYTEARRAEIADIMKAAGKAAPYAVASLPEGKELLLGAHWSARISLSGETGQAFIERLKTKGKKGKK